MKKKLIGLLVGCVLCLSTSTAFAEQAKQYILTPATYPVVVNGVQYTDTSHPILSMGGSTYVPLAKLGDLTGVQYTWNSELGRVEIVTGVLPQGKVTIQDLSPEVKYEGALPGGKITLTPDIKLESGTILDRYTDEDDASLVLARIKGLEEPPKLSEGWVQAGLLEKMLGNVEVIYDGNDLVIKSGFSVVKKQEFLRLNLPSDWKSRESGETTVNGIRIKKHNKVNYFNAEDLIKTGILK